MTGKRKLKVNAQKSMGTGGEVREGFLRHHVLVAEHPLFCLCIGYGKIHQILSEHTGAKSSHSKHTCMSPGALFHRRV